MTLAYCPALDFNPLESQMTDIELLTSLESPRSNLEKAIAIRAALNAAAPSALNIKPQVQRKPKQPRAPRPAPDLLNGHDTQETAQ